MCILITGIHSTCEEQTARQTKKVVISHEIQRT
jgi:hypothetical protein